MKFGWCLDGHHADANNPDAPGRCPGQIGGPDGITCSCPCHTPKEETG